MTSCIAGVAGIDARISAASCGLKYSFEVLRGGDPRKNHLRYSGADRHRVDGGGELKLPAGGVTIVDSRPVASQKIGGRDAPVEVRFVQHGDEVTFAVGKSDRARPLTIDPLSSTRPISAAAATTSGARLRSIQRVRHLWRARPTISICLSRPAHIRPRWHGDPNTIKPDALVAKINPAGTHFDYVTYSGG